MVAVTRDNGISIVSKRHKRNDSIRKKPVVSEKSEKNMINRTIGRMTVNSPLPDNALDSVTQIVLFYEAFSKSRKDATITKQLLRLVTSFGASRYFWLTVLGFTTASARRYTASCGSSDF